jgi:hypothetical protein
VNILAAVQIWLLAPGARIADIGTWIPSVQNQTYVLAVRLLISTITTMFAAAAIAALYRELRRCEDAPSPPQQMPQP